MNKLTKILCATFLLSAMCLLVVHTNAQSRAGQLDSTYNGTGKVFTKVPSEAFRLYCSDLDANGNLVAGGIAYLDINGGDRYAMTVRYKPDGSLDPSFGYGGVYWDSTVNCRLYGIIVAADGKILACGYTNTGLYSNEFMVYRFLPNGFPDSTFSNDGRAFVNFGTIYGNFPNDIHEQSDGKIIVSGTYTPRLNADHYAICRFLPNGTLDNSFGTNGIVTDSIGYTNSSNFNTKLDASGRLVIAGYVSPDMNSDDGFATLTRYTTSGVRNVTFGIGGIAKFQPTRDQYAFQGLAIAGNGSIYVCGTFTDSVTSDWDFIAAKYTSTGQLDPSFGVNGYVKFDFFNDKDEAHDMVIQPDGKLVITGQSRNNGVWEYATLRLLPNGIPDSTFGLYGLSHFEMDSAQDAFPVSIELQADGKMLLTGFGDIKVLGGYDQVPTIARILGDANLGILNHGTTEVKTLIYPNPVVDIAMLQYELSEAATVSATVLSVDGRVAKTIFTKNILSIGNHKLTLDLSDFAAGTYVLRLTANTVTTMVRFTKL